MKNSIVSTLSEILIKSVKHDLSYSLKCDLRSISNSIFVPIGVFYWYRAPRGFFSKQSSWMDNAE